MADEKDDVSVEGSAARAADRGRDQLGISDERSIGALDTPEAVNALVSDFLDAVLAVRKSYLTDELKGDQAKAEIRYIARKYGLVIMGKDKTFKTSPWQSPERLGKRIPKVIPPVPGVSDPGEALFVTLAGSFSALNVAVENGRISDANAKRELLELMDQVSTLILGY
ncbi:hypothetical protein GTB64_004449 [Salmonella enterica]|nr:hypothetical protein [Salmonella enterica]